MPASREETVPKDNSKGNPRACQRLQDAQETSRSCSTKRRATSSTRQALSKQDGGGATPVAVCYHVGGGGASTIDPTFGESPRKAFELSENRANARSEAEGGHVVVAPTGIVHVYQRTGAHESHSAGASK